MSVHYSVRFGFGLRISEDDVGMDRLDDIVSPSNLPDGFDTFFGGDMDGNNVGVLIARPEHVTTIQTTLDYTENQFGIFMPESLVEYSREDAELLGKFAYDNDVLPYIGYFIVSGVG